jgi:tRNA(fMet)-specific endonuclease VapC
MAGHRVLAAFAAAVGLPFDDRAAAVLEVLLATKVRMATMDLRIASIALSHELTLLTRNVPEFGKVPGLLI